jgi:peptidoglycan-associated lipoprotein
MMSPRPAVIIGLGATALAAVLLAACATKPKYAPSASGRGPAPAAAQPDARSSPTSPVSEGEMGALPGSARDFLVNAGDRVYFDYDHDEIRPDAAPILEAQASWLQRYRSVSIRIEGNADERGTREYNFALGARRAKAVKEFLVGRGIDPGRITTISYGKERPIDSGSTEQAWSHNRNAHTAIVGGAR